VYLAWDGHHATYLFFGLAVEPEEVAHITGGRFGWALLQTLAGKGTCANPRPLYHEIHAAAKAKSPGASAKAVANRLLAATTDEGTFSVSQEPDDTELDRTPSGGDEGADPPGDFSHPRYRRVV
jgi:hypothetical protein